MDIIQMIQSLGFPVACVIACGLFIYKTTQQTREDNLRREERTAQQQDKLADTLDKATDTIDRINTRLDIIEHKIDNLAQE